MSQCSHCQSPLSPSATACPQCGHPTHSGAETRKVGVGLGIGIFLVPVVFVWFLLRKGHSTLARAVGFGWLLLAFVMVIGASSSETTGAVADVGTSASQPVAARPVAPPPPPVVLARYEASDLASAYDDNTVSANATFKGKRFIVTGVVEDISTDFMDRPYITMVSRRHRFSEPQFSMKRGYENYAGSLKKGQTISLECTGNGDVMKTAMNKDCVPAD